MAKRYDATLKQLVEGHPADWLALAGFPTAGGVRMVDADVSAVTAAADKVIRVGGPRPYIAHAEFQAGPDASLDARALLYHVLLRSRHPLPVRTVAFLLRRSAATGVTGRVRHEAGPGEWLDFSYRVVRVWELPAGAVLTGGVGTLPLAIISAVGRDDVGGVIARMQKRLTRVPAPVRDVAWAATYLLGGLRYDDAFLEQLLKGVWDMEESATYRATIKRGRLEEARAMLIVVAKEKFGPPDAKTRDRLDAIASVTRLEAMGRRIFKAADWNELLNTKD